MNRKFKFAITTIWIILTRAYDAYCTYQLTPDLSKENNPLVSIFGFTWIPLLLVIGLLTTYAIYAFYVSTFKDYNLMPDEKGYSLSHFIGYIHLGRKKSWISTFYMLPDNLSRFNHYMGHLLTRCLVYAGIVSTVMWILINYTNYYAAYHSALLIYSIILVGCVLICLDWYLGMFHKYNNGVFNTLKS